MSSSAPFEVAARPRGSAREWLRPLVPPAGVVAAAVAFAWFWGAGRTAFPDSCYYLDAATHLLQGHGYVTSVVEWSDAGSTTPVTVFGPGFPAAIAALMALGMDGREALAALVFAGYVAYAALAYGLLRVAVPRNARWFTALATLVLLTQPALRSGLERPLSDLPGAALCLACVLLLIRRPASLAAFELGLGVLLGLAVLTRWANLYLAAVALLIVATTDRAGQPAGLRLRSVTSAVRAGIPIAVLVMPAWLRNFRHTGTLMGPRAVEAKSLFNQVGVALRGLFDWFEHAHLAIANPAAALVHAALAILLFGLLVAQPRTAANATERSLVALSAGYSAFMVLSSAMIQFDPVSESRFWLAVYPMLVAAGLLRVGRIRSRLARSTAVTAWGALALHAVIVALTEIPTALASPRDEGYFASHLDESAVIREAVRRADAGECGLAADDEYVALPRSGSRTIRMVRPDEIGVLDTYGGPPLCVLIVHDERLRWSVSGPYQSAFEHVAALGRAGRLRRIAADGVAELWLTGAPPR